MIEKGKANLSNWDLYRIKELKQLRAFFDSTIQGLPFYLVYRFMAQRLINYHNGWGAFDGK
jgi:hypothetical protein